MSTKHLRILGTRGVPAAHGGFETFAEHLALHLAGRGWNVTVYCQGDRPGSIFEDVWGEVRRVHVPVESRGPFGTIVFDWRSTRHAAREEGVVLTLGYNTAVFCSLYRIAGRKNVINMDGIEWRRRKWGIVARTWFWINDWMGCWLGDRLVADHPEIARHLATRVSAGKITMIPYGADRIDHADAGLIEPFGLSPGRYAILIARPEPENSVLEIVRAWSRRRRGLRLVVLGHYDAANRYHVAVKSAASDEILFPGAIYDKALVQALRFHSRLYLHGHQVGGTNPSLVEALGAGNPVLAHDNRYNRWVAEGGARYFVDEDGCAALLDELLDDAAALGVMARAGRARHEAAFTWEKVLGEYEELLASCAPVCRASQAL